jgi:hypothetical protein
MLHGVDDDEPEHGDENDHDRHHANQCHGAADGTELVTRHLPERATVASNRAEQRDEVLHATAEHGTDENPQGAR